MKTNNQRNLLKRAKEQFGDGVKEIKKTSNKNVFEVLFFDEVSRLWNPENAIGSPSFTKELGYNYLEKPGLFVLNYIDQSSYIWNPKNGIKSPCFPTKSAYKYLEKSGLFVLNVRNNISRIWNPENEIVSQGFLTKKVEQVISRLKPLNETFKEKILAGNVLTHSLAEIIENKAALRNYIRSEKDPYLMIFGSKEKYINSIFSFEGDCTDTDIDKILDLIPGKEYHFVFGDPCHALGTISKDIYFSELGIYFEIKISPTLTLLMSGEGLNIIE